MGPFINVEVKEKEKADKKKMSREILEHRPKFWVEEREREGG